MSIEFFTGLDEIEQAIVTHDDGSTTSMPKATYDEQQAQQVAHLTESVTKAK